MMVVVERIGEKKAQETEHGPLSGISGKKVYLRIRRVIHFHRSILGFSVSPHLKHRPIEVDFSKVKQVSNKDCKLHK